jgi:hypothetical protein
MEDSTERKCFKIAESLHLLHCHSHNAISCAFDVRPRCWKGKCHLADTLYIISFGSKTRDFFSQFCMQSRVMFCTESEVTAYSTAL